MLDTQKEEKELTGPVIEVDISGFEDKSIEGLKPLRSKPVKKTTVVGAGSYHAATLNGMLAALGIPSLERIINETINNQDNYVTYVVAITRKGKNRTFKKKISRKRILHKDRRLDEFRITMNSMKRWIN